jgi:hypothetical protein
LVDFHLNPLEGIVNTSGRRLLLALKPWQIATIQLGF